MAWLGPLCEAVDAATANSHTYFKLFGMRDVTAMIREFISAAPLSFCLTYAGCKFIPSAPTLPTDQSIIYLIRDAADQHYVGADSTWYLLPVPCRYAHIELVTASKMYIVIQVQSLPSSTHWDVLTFHIQAGCASVCENSIDRLTYTTTDVLNVGNGWTQRLQPRMCYYDHGVIVDNPIAVPDRCVAIRFDNYRSVWILMRDGAVVAFFAIN